MNTREELERIIRKVFEPDIEQAEKVEQQIKKLYVPNTGMAAMMEQRSGVNRLEAKMRLWTYKITEAILDAGFIKIKPFEWMERWLKAYDKEHKTNFAKEVLDWINQQPMAGG